MTDFLADLDAQFDSGPATHPYLDQADRRTIVVAVAALVETPSLWFWGREGTFARLRKVIDRLGTDAEPSVGHYEHEEWEWPSPLTLIDHGGRDA